MLSPACVLHWQRADEPAGDGDWVYSLRVQGRMADGPQLAAEASRAALLALGPLASQDRFVRLFNQIASAARLGDHSFTFVS